MNSLVYEEFDETISEILKSFYSVLLMFLSVQDSVGINLCP